MRILLLSAALLCWGTSALADLAERVTVFKSGEDGYHTYRIPAVVLAANGDLLAFCEGRRNSASDSGDIDLVMKRSTDQGATWGDLELICDHGEGVIGNPAPVVDRATGDVIVLLTRQDPGTHEGAIRAGRDRPREPMVIRSTDHGRTWTEPRSIAATATRPGWRWYATGPCHAIQLEQGDHAGRLVVPANFSAEGGAVNHQYSAHALLSDDGGMTWRIGAVDETKLGDNHINPNESTVAELPDGRLIFSTRDQRGESPATRAVAYSSDGGESFDRPYAEEPGLIGPVCQGSLLGIRSEKTFRLLFSGPSKPGARERMQLRISDDHGATWHNGPILYEGVAAYSDLVELPDQRVGCLYEIDRYRAIVWSDLPIESLPEAPAEGGGR
ncbi:MAG: sialidase family protein [Planctomycetota bacterium]